MSNGRCFHTALFFSRWTDPVENAASRLSTTLSHAAKAPFLSSVGLPFVSHPLIFPVNTPKDASWPSNTID
jgi:hypothetical protein